jgi:nucleoside-diphosphate-sugar epimerase
MVSTSKERVLITGGLGYLGTVMAPYLARHGFVPVVADVGFFEDCLITSPDPFEILRKDARDLSLKDLEGFDAVVHLAGISNDPFGDLTAEKVYDPTRHYAKAIAAMCKSLGTRFIFASSCSIYGKGDGAQMTEESVVFPQTPYSINKLQIEGDLTELSGPDFQPVILRFATVYGMSPRIRFDVYINMLVGMALSRGEILLNSDGKAWRPNLHILDLCKAVLFSLRAPRTSGGPLTLNVGDSQDNYQILDVAKMVEGAVPGSRIKFMNQGKEDSEKWDLIRDRKVPDGVDTRTYRVSFEKIKTALPGFQCDWRVPEGIARLVSDLRAIGLSEAQFSSRDFYRLQKIEHHFKSGRLTETLRWARP